MPVFRHWRFLSSGRRVRDPNLTGAGSPPRTSSHDAGRQAAAVRDRLRQQGGQRAHVMGGALSTKTEDKPETRRGPLL